MSDIKAELSNGWIVKQSKSYPDRVFYFNVNTGVSTWEFPDLLQESLKTRQVTGSDTLVLSSRPSQPANTYGSPDSLTSVTSQHSYGSLNHQHVMAPFKSSHDVCSADKIASILSIPESPPNVMPTTKSSHKRCNNSKTPSAGSPPNLAKRMYETASSSDVLSSMISHNRQPFQHVLKASEVKSSITNLPSHKNHPFLSANSGLTKSSEYKDTSNMKPIQSSVTELLNKVHVPNTKLKDTCSKVTQKCSTISNKLLDHDSFENNVSPSKNSAIHQSRNQSNSHMRYRKILTAKRIQIHSKIENHASKKCEIQSGINNDNVRSNKDTNSLDKMNFNTAVNFGKKDVIRAKRKTIPVKRDAISVKGDAMPVKKDCGNYTYDSQSDIKKGKISPVCFGRTCLSGSKLSDHIKNSLPKIEIALNDRTCVRQRDVSDSTEVRQSATYNATGVHQSYINDRTAARQKDVNDTAGVRQPVVNDNTGVRQTFSNTKRKEHDLESEGCDTNLQGHKRKRKPDEAVKPHFTRKKNLDNSNDEFTDNIQQAGKHLLKIVTGGNVNLKGFKSMQSSVETRNIQLKDDTFLKNVKGNNVSSSLPKRNLEVRANVDLMDMGDHAANLKGPGEIHDLGDNHSDQNFERNNDKEYKLFIGNKDKLMSIQSWINNIQEDAWSESPCQDYSTKCDAPCVVSKSTGCGIISSSNLVSPSSERAGCPGDYKKPDMTSCDLVAMEVDCLVPNHDIDQQDNALLNETFEEMDFEVVLTEVRQQVNMSNIKDLSGSFQVDGTRDEQQTLRTHSKVLIVVDTNVIISKLELLEDLKDYQLEGLGKPTLLIPWIVLCELDALKEMDKHWNPKLSLATQYKARKGISFLKDHFSNNHPRLIGQSPQQAEEASKEFKAKCNDDAVLQACLHSRKSYLKVILLTNDNNLINKALVSGIPAYTINDILLGLDRILQESKSSNDFCTRQLEDTSNTVTVASVRAEQQQYINNDFRRSSVSSSSKNRTVNSVTEAHNNNQMFYPVLQQFHNDANSGSKSVQHVGGNTTMRTQQYQQSCTTENSLKMEANYSVEMLADDICCKMRALLRESLGLVLEVEMKLAYTDIWLNIVFRKPPWSLKDVLECWKKHWIAIFGMVFNRKLFKNVDRLLEHFSQAKCYTISIMLEACTDAYEILDECNRKGAKDKRFGDNFHQYVECVRYLMDLCAAVMAGTIGVSTINSLESYLSDKMPTQSSLKVSAASQNRLDNYSTSLSVDPVSSAMTLNRSHSVSQKQPQQARNQLGSQSFLVENVPGCSVKSTLPAVSLTNPPQTDSSADLLPNVNSINMTGYGNNLTLQAVPCIVNSQSMSCIDSMQSYPNINVPQTVYCVNNPNRKPCSQEEIAGECLQNIWQMIDNCCAYIQTAISSGINTNVRLETHTLLQKILPKVIELRKFYSSLLDIPVMELMMHEDAFTGLCRICNTFCNDLPFQPVSSKEVTPMQFLALYSLPQHRVTLQQFLQHLDEMLCCLYQFLYAYPCT